MSDFSFSHIVFIRFKLQTPKLGLAWETVKKVLSLVLQIFLKFKLIHLLIGLSKCSWVKVFRINPDFRIFACQKVHYFFLFPIKIAKFEGFQGGFFFFLKNLTCTHECFTQSELLLISDSENLGEYTTETILRDTISGYRCLKVINFTQMIPCLTAMK